MFPITEVSSQLQASGSCTLDSAGYGTIVLDPSNARQRWEVTGIVVSTNQAATATVVPVATAAVNTADISVLSPGNNRGQSWSGNQDVFSGKIDVGPCDTLSIGFGPPPGATSGQIADLSGVICTAVVTGTRFTRRQ